ncbi:hypothetical protein EDB84DRAFT_1567730 [Lactarius hengduanensis]|nr:hypothetical protein EDB84DRAFT_1567730 [Lactarius hengduanensis]
MVHARLLVDLVDPTITQHQRKPLWRFTVTEPGLTCAPVPYAKPDKPPPPSCGWWYSFPVKWKGLDHKFTWIPRDELLEKWFQKIVSQFDDLEASREAPRRHGAIQYNEIAGLSGGQKIKLVIGACLWNNPQLDEPRKFLDREALGGLAVAIRDWSGAVVIISEFVNALCPEIWNISEGRMTHKDKAAVVEEAFADTKSPRGSGANTPIRSRIHSPAASAAATPAASGTGKAHLPFR